MQDPYSARLLPLAFWRQERDPKLREENFYQEHSEWPLSRYWRLLKRRLHRHKKPRKRWFPGFGLGWIVARSGGACRSAACGGFQLELPDQHHQ